MAYTFNGIGTAFYGQRDFRPDGSYVTTEWIVFLCIPLLPIRSMRLSYQGPAQPRFLIGIGSADSYAVYEKTSPNWRQVLCVYSYTIFVVAWMVLLACFYGRLAETMDMTLVGILFFISFTIPALLPLAVRLPARHRLRTLQSGADNKRKRL